SEHFAVGFALHHIEGGTFDGATTFDLSIILRRSRFFAFSLMAYDLLGPTGAVGLDGLTTPISGVGAFTLRPTGDDRLTLEGFGSVANDGRVGFGGYAAVGLPGGARVLVRDTVEHFRYRAENRISLGAELPWDMFSLFGGFVGGDGYAGSPGYYAGATTGPRPLASIPGFQVVADVIAPAHIDGRAAVELLDRLYRLVDDPRAQAVLLRLGGGRLPLAYGEELAQAVETLEAAGKPVLCHLEVANAATLLACAGATKTLLAPSGLARLRSPRAVSDPEALLALWEGEAAMVRAPREPVDEAAFA